MVDRRRFTPSGDNPNVAVPVNEFSTVPTERMAHLLADLCATAGSVLEIGTGTGYQAAILAERCAEVFTIEASVELYRDALLNLQEFNNVFPLHGDGFHFNTGAQFDAVLVTCAAAGIAPVWERQVREGGRLIVPLKLKEWATARICVYSLRGGIFRCEEVAAYAPFVECTLERSHLDLPPIGEGTHGDN